MLADLGEFAKNGLTDDEVDKTRSQARAELVETYESVDATAARLSVNAALGLPPDHEATASARRDSATKDELNKLAARFYDPKDAILVVVGPKATIAAHLQKLGLPPAEMRDAEGNVVKTAR
jgi:zinc protease